MTKRNAPKKSSKSAPAKKRMNKNRAMPAQMAGHVKRSGPANGRGDGGVSVAPATVNPTVQLFQPLALTSVAATYAAWFVEIANANVRFTLEFSQRLARIRSPLEIPAVGAEFLRRRMQMLREQSASLLPKAG